MGGKDIESVSSEREKAVLKRLLATPPDHKRTVKTKASQKRTASLPSKKEPGT
jgi:hypothetical protein